MKIFQKKVQIKIGVSLQPTGKWNECISQSERGLGSCVCGCTRGWTSGSITNCSGFPFLAGFALAFLLEECCNFDRDLSPPALLNLNEVELVCVAGVSKNSREKETKLEASSWHLLHLSLRSLAIEGICCRAIKLFEHEHTNLWRSLLLLPRFLSALKWLKNHQLKLHRLP